MLASLCLFVSTSTVPPDPSRHFLETREEELKIPPSSPRKRGGRTTRRLSPCGRRRCCFNLCPSSPQFLLPLLHLLAPPPPYSSSRMRALLRMSPDPLIVALISRAPFALRDVPMSCAAVSAKDGVLKMWLLGVLTSQHRKYVK